MTEGHDSDFGLLRLADVSSDVVINKWLTLPQSFIAIIKTPNLTVKQIPSQWTGLLNTFEHFEEPKLPLQDLYGRLPEYWIKKQHQAWVVQVRDSIYKSRSHLTANDETKQFVNDQTWAHSTHTTPMNFLEITSSVKL